MGGAGCQTDPTAVSARRGAPLGTRRTEEGGILCSIYIYSYVLEGVRVSQTARLLVMLFMPFGVVEKDRRLVTSGFQIIPSALGAVLSSDRPKEKLYAILTRSPIWRVSESDTELCFSHANQAPRKVRTPPVVPEPTVTHDFPACAQTSMEHNLSVV